MRIGRVGPAAHQGDLVVDGLGIGAQEHDAEAPVLLGDVQAEDVAVERDHPFKVAHVDADVSEPQHPRHGFPRVTAWTCSTAALEYSERGPGKRRSLPVIDDGTTATGYGHLRDRMRDFDSTTAVPHPRC